MNERRREEMNHAELFTEVLKNHGSNYMRYALSKGAVKTYYIKLFKQREHLSAGVFANCLNDFGARVYARFGMTERDITDLMLDEDYSHGNGTKLDKYVQILRIVGWEIIVKDGDKEYRLTSGVIDGKRKTDSGPGT